MTPTELKAYLNQIINKRLQISTMIWGSPGIGKSSIVAQVAQEQPNTLFQAWSYLLLLCS